MTSLFAGHIMITGRLRVITALHTGTGERKADRRLWESDGGEDDGPLEPELSLIQRDHAGKPYLAGSSIKGALRSYARINGATDKRTRSLFGEIKDEGQAGAMGALTVFGATWIDGPLKSDVPFYEASSQSAISAHVRIDKGRGVADANGLFHEEEVVPGSVFDFRARYMDVLDTASDGLLADLIAALQNGFVALGAGTGVGAGQVKLEQLKIEAFRLDPATGALKASSNVALAHSANPLQVSGDRFLFRFKGDGPYLSLDQDHARELRQLRRKGEDTKDKPNLKGAVDAAGNPSLKGTGLKGSLRARALFLARLHCPDQADAIVDELFGPHLPDENRAAKGRLEFERIACTNKGTLFEATSVHLDDFSGAPLDGALFSVQCAFRPVFEINLRLSPKASDKARDFLDKVLLADLVQNGIKLGHGQARGFGWFKVEKRKE